MIKKLLEISFIKIVSLFFSFLFPFIVVRFYSSYDFGFFNYLFTFLVIISMLQNGFTATFRNTISKIQGYDIKVEYLKIVNNKIFKIISKLMIFLLILSLFIFHYNKSYGMIIGFLSFSLINVVYPIVSSFFDSINKTKKFLWVEIFFTIISVILIIVLSFYNFNVFFIALIIANYRSIYATILLFLIIRKSKKIELTSEYKIININDVYFFLIQVLNSAIYIYFMHNLSILYGLALFGVFSIYYRFISFPQQILGLVGPYLWVKFIMEANKKENKVDVNKLTILFLVMVFVWGVFSFYSMDFIVAKYTGKNFQFPGEILLLIICIALNLIKDFFSIFLNALNYMKGQFFLILSLTIIMLISLIQLNFNSEIFYLFFCGMYLSLSLVSFFILRNKLRLS